jgi:UDPglucose 6-dehydrogenase
MVKQASNAFLATKISFINDIAGICDAVGADIDTVAEGMGYDPRIGPSYLKAGIGFGGSCLPKDLRALIHTASRAGIGVEQLTATLAVNERQRKLVVQLLSDRLGVRDSPATALAARLADLGAVVVATDPAIRPSGEQTGIPEEIQLAEGPYEAAANADAVVVATEWDVFTQLDWSKLAASMAGSLVIDGRNCLDAARIRAAGLDYAGIGRAVL